MLEHRKRFLQVCEEYIICEYIDAATCMKWNIGGQQKTMMSDLHNYICLQGWDKKMHYLHNKRFKLALKYYRWNHKLSNQLCHMNNIKIIEDEETRLLISGRTRVKIMRPCFPILVVAIKYDIN